MPSGVSTSDMAVCLSHTAQRSPFWRARAWNLRIYLGSYVQSISCDAAKVRGTSLCGGEASNLDGRVTPRWDDWYLR